MSLLLADLPFLPTANGASPYLPVRYLYQARGHGGKDNPHREQEPLVVYLSFTV